MDNCKKRKQIMRMVEKLAANRRYNQITLEEVAQASQVGKGTIYRYFDNKEDLFFQVASSGFEQLCQLLRESTPSDSTFYHKISNACTRIVEFFDSRKTLMQMMQSEANLAHWQNVKFHQMWTEKRKMLIDALADIFRQAIAQGSLRDDICPQAMATYLLALLRTCVKDMDEVPQENKSCDLLVDIFLNGIKASTVDVSEPNFTAAKRQIEC